MAKVFEEISDALATWVAKQKIFFVATAPLSGAGLVNCSPKGMDSLRILGPRRVAYLDLTGSGVETIAHVRENGRIVIMLTAFEGPPKIVRFHGRADVHEPNSEAFAELASHFPEHPGTRAIIDIHLERISDSCGYSVPLYDYLGDRDVLCKWSQKKGPDGIEAYQQQNNRESIEGLPGLS